MKNKLLQLILGIALALGIFTAPAPAAAAPPPQTRIIDITFCWSVSTFGPNGCNAQAGSEPFSLIGNNTQGSIVYAIGTSDAVTGTYRFTQARQNISFEFVNADPAVVRTTYTGSRYAGGGQNCYRGPMMADMVSEPDLTGVWFGCIRP